MGATRAFVAIAVLVAAVAAAAHEYEELVVQRHYLNHQDCTGEYRNHTYTPGACYGFVTSWGSVTGTELSCAAGSIHLKNFYGGESPVCNPQRETRGNTYSPGQCVPTASPAGSGSRAYHCAKAPKGMLPKYNAKCALCVTGIHGGLNATYCKDTDGAGSGTCWNDAYCGGQCTGDRQACVKTGAFEQCPNASPGQNKSCSQCTEFDGFWCRGGRNAAANTCWNDFNCGGICDGTCVGSCE